MNTEKILFTWSGGKDSALALYELQESRKYEIEALLTTVTAGYNRISMHGVRNSLLERQAGSLGLRLEKMRISRNAGNEEYEGRITRTLDRYRKKGVSGVAFGDIFLEDLRSYRDRQLSRVGLKGLFPLWKKNTRDMAARFIELGFKAVVSCVDSKFLDSSFSGRLFDRKFLSDLPDNVDPCGENGEFHSFVYGGPIFKEEISYKKGRVVLRDGRFYYCDLIDIG
ncbi:MAG: diphthine--ammonia ligase [Candidatus Omnitrophica bacterium]|nr:diphthine--ammonia ligase [Candidatus Omnitrophota bacterium]MDD5770810.1 diphthine--ammonia ligase [Candidatus Omnitrophota bacterium]